MTDAVPAGHGPVDPLSAAEAPRALCRFYAADGTLLAIGSSIEPGVRWKTYGTGRTWWLEVARVEVQHLPHDADVVPALAAAVDAEQPKYQTEQPNFDAMTDAEVTEWFKGKTKHELLEWFSTNDSWDPVFRLPAQPVSSEAAKTRPRVEDIPIGVDILLPMAVNDRLTDAVGTDLRRRSRIIADALTAYFDATTRG